MWVRFLLLLLFKNKKFKLITKFSIYNFFKRELNPSENVDFLFFKKKIPNSNSHLIRSSLSYSIIFFIFFLKKNINTPTPSLIFKSDLFFYNFYKFLLLFFQKKNNHFFFSILDCLNFYNHFFFNNFFQLSFLFNFQFKNTNKIKSSTFFFKNFGKKLPYNKHETSSFNNLLKNLELKKNNYSKKIEKKKQFKSYFNSFSFDFKSLKIIRFSLLNSSISFNFLSKIMFNSNNFNKSYFKKSQNYYFQLNKSDITSKEILKFYKTSPNLSTYELYRTDTKLHDSFLKSALLKYTQVFNFYNQNENIFFNKTNDFVFNFKLVKVNEALLPFAKIIQLLKKKLKRKINYAIRSYFLHFLEMIYFFDFFKKKTFLNTPLPLSFYFKHNTITNTDESQINWILSINSIFFSIFKGFLFKFFLSLSNNFEIDIKNLNFIYFFFKNYMNSFFFYNKSSVIFKTNLLPHISFYFIFKKKMLKMFTYDKFTSHSSPFYINSLIRFFENITGKKIIFKFNNFLNKFLTFQEKSLCFNWAPKVRVFRKMLGPRLFLAESLEILYLSFKLKDPFFLAHWLTNMMRKISFWKYRLFFRYIKYVLRYFFVPMFSQLSMKGVKFRLKGKISVAGNARTRTLLQRTGINGHSSFKNKVVQDLTLIRTFTGVLGLKVWIFF